MVHLCKLAVVLLGCMDGNSQHTRFRHLLFLVRRDDWSSSRTESPFRLLICVFFCVAGRLSCGASDDLTIRLRRGCLRSRRDDAGVSFIEWSRLDV